MSIFKHIAIVTLALSFVSCSIRDDRSDCSGDVFLHFIYNGDGDTDIFPSKIMCVNMYVYSTDNGTFHSEYAFDKQTLDASQGAHIMLPPGTYRIVCWGNAGERSAVDKSWGTGHIAEPAYFRSPVTYTGTDSLYCSILDLNVPETLQDVEGICNFAGSHIKMRVKLDGFAGLTDITDGEKVNVTFVHEGCPVATDFSNLPFEERCEVVPAMQPDPEDPDAYILRYNVFRFTEDDRQSRLSIRYEDGTEMYSVPMADFIGRYGIRITGRHEITIPVKITYSPVGITVVGWDIEDVDPGFDKD